MPRVGRFSLGDWGRPLLGLILAVFVLGPSLCLYDCAADDLSPPSASAGVNTAVYASPPASSEHGVGKVAGLCPHGGHCHHNPFADLTATAAQPQIIAYAGVKRDLSPSLVPASLTPTGPERPPKA